MDYQNYSTDWPKRKSGKHLTDVERGAIQSLHRLGYSLRKIAAEINCSPSTVLYELRRGTPPRKSSRGRAPGYLAKRGSEVYKENRSRCRRHHKIESCRPFIDWMVEQMDMEDWSVDSCVGYARAHKLFPEIPCSKTIYNEIWAGNLPVSPFALPEALSRRKKSKKPRKNRQILGRSIDERPEIVKDLTEFGHWEIDTVIGRKKGHESVVLTLHEMLTGNYLTLKIACRESNAVMAGINVLRKEYGSKFSAVFKTITSDNGKEFSRLSELEGWSTSVFFAHPYSSWERPRNERSNRMLRRYIPKGKSMDDFTADEIMCFADKINAKPRKRLGYRTPEELFEAYLDNIYYVV